MTLWSQVTNGAVSTPGVTSYITSTFPATVRSTITDGISDCTKVSGTGKNCHITTTMSMRVQSFPNL